LKYRYCSNFRKTPIRIGLKLKGKKPMSQKLLTMLIVGLFVLACLVPFNRSQSFSALNKTSPTQPEGTKVEVTFAGLMVFRQVGDHYEVGILNKDAAPDHQFAVLVGKTPLDADKVSQWALAGPWSMNVVGPSGENHSIDVQHLKPCHRLRETQHHNDADKPHFFDFCWLMDLEKEFNGGKQLRMIKGKLTPIIKLNNGELYTKYNYDELERAKGGSEKYKPLGFVADMISLRVNLQANEKLELRTVNNELVFSLTAGGETEAGIYNAPPEHSYVKSKDGKLKEEESHFQYYYNLFAVSKPKQYKIRVSDDANNNHPPNYYPHSRPSVYDKDDPFNKFNDLCFDNQMCGAVFLGRSTEPLETSSGGAARSRTRRRIRRHPR